jgi:hypothetical protein
VSSNDKGSISRSGNKTEFEIFRPQFQISIVNYRLRRRGNELLKGYA